MSTSGRIWVTRTRPQADATAERLRVLGLSAVVAPVLETRPIQPASLDLNDVAALAFTSAAAAAAFAALSSDRRRPVFAVGDATAAAAREAGFTQVSSADGDVRALAALIARDASRSGSVLNPTARNPAADLPALLAALGVRAEAVVVYETVPTALTAPPVDVQGVLIHSAKAAERVAALIDADWASERRLFAISKAAGAPLLGLEFQRAAIASRPDETTLLRLLRD